MGPAGCSARRCRGRCAADDQSAWSEARSHGRSRPPPSPRTHIQPRAECRSRPRRSAASTASRRARRRQHQAAAMVGNAASPQRCERRQHRHALLAHSPRPRRPRRHAVDRPRSAPRVRRACVVTCRARRRTAPRRAPFAIRHPPGVISAAMVGRRPSVDRQCEGRLADEHVAGARPQNGAQVGSGSRFVVARHHPDLAAVLGAAPAEPSTWPAGCSRPRTPPRSIGSPLLQRAGGRLVPGGVLPRGAWPRQQVFAAAGARGDRRAHG